LKIVAAAGAMTTLLYIVLTIFPIVEVQSRFLFAAKIIVITVAANFIGILIFIPGERRRRQILAAEKVR
jgi:hypothetical protein